MIPSACSARRKLFDLTHMRSSPNAKRRQCCRQRASKFGEGVFDLRRRGKDLLVAHIEGRRCERKSQVSHVRVDGFGSLHKNTASVKEAALSRQRPSRQSPGATSTSTLAALDAQCDAGGDSCLIAANNGRSRSALNTTTFPGLAAADFSSPSLSPPRSRAYAARDHGGDEHEEGNVWVSLAIKPCPPRAFASASRCSAEPVQGSGCALTWAPIRAPSVAPRRSQRGSFSRPQVRGI
jgi:hypothetical protein